MLISLEYTDGSLITSQSRSTFNWFDIYPAGHKMLSEINIWPPHAFDPAGIFNHNICNK